MYPVWIREIKEQRKLCISTKLFYVMLQFSETIPLYENWAGSISLLLPLSLKYYCELFQKKTTQCFLKVLFWGLMFMKTLPRGKSRTLSNIWSFCETFLWTAFSLQLFFTENLDIIDVWKGPKNTLATFKKNGWWIPQPIFWDLLRVFKGSLYNFFLHYCCFYNINKNHMPLEMVFTTMIFKLYMKITERPWS